MTQPLIWIGTAVVALLGATTSQAADSHAAGGRVRVKVVGGRLVASCRLSSETASLPANLFVSYDRLCGLELHNKAAHPLKIESADGSTTPITIHLSGFDVVVDRREHGDEDALNAFTKAYSDELEEIAVVGTIGANILSQYHVTFDVGNGSMRIGAPHEEIAERPTGPESTYIRAAVTTELVWLPVMLRDEHLRVVALGSHAYDSVIDIDACDEYEAYDGDIGSVSSGGVDFSKIIPWRPEEYTLVHIDGALGTLGINFLKNFRVAIDRVNGWVGITPVGVPKFPSEERAFFAARASEEAEDILEWLDDHGDTRLAGEAADACLLIQVDDGASLGEVITAVEWVDRTRHPKLRATAGIDTMKMLMESRQPEAAVSAGRFAIQGGREDRYPESVHRLHSMLGEVLLDEGRGREAWEHLMSAAFGLNEAVGAPDQARVNLLLGRYYEKIGKPNRAMSRYVQAVITPEAGPQAVAAIARLQESLGGEPFSVDLIERLIAGKVRNMTAPDRFAETDATQTNRTVLVEHVTNPHFGMKKGESWRPFTEGGSMVFEGLESYFPRSRVAMLSYHIEAPQPVAIMNPLSVASGNAAGGRPAFLIDGIATAPGVFDYFKADQVYAGVRDAVIAKLSSPSSHDLSLSASLEEGRVNGTLTIRGEADDRLSVEIVLVERGVLYPGLGATVVHRMVARGLLTDGAEPVPFQPTDGGMTVSFGQDIAAVIAANQAYLDHYEEEEGRDPTRLSVEIAHDQVVVVAILRDGDSREIVQSAFVDLNPDRRGDDGL